MLNKLRGLIMEEEGQGMTEYGLVLGLIAVAVVGVLVAFRTQVIAIFQDAVDVLTNRPSVTEPVSGT